MGAITTAPVSVSLNDTARFYSSLRRLSYSRGVPAALPIDPHLDAIVRAVSRHRAAVVTAAPGAGKTTRVPPALAKGGRVLLLQPRRVAARAIARWIAAEQGWTAGREVGWHVRFDRHFTAESRVVVATEGILTARLQQDALVQDLRTIVIDEFHERSIHADLGLALAREAWRARADLNLVVMSATIDSARVSAYLDDCPVIDVPGRLYPLEIGYDAAAGLEQAIVNVLPRSGGAVLCFLPGAPEIRRAAERLGALRALGTTPVVPLHGSLDADAQDAALRPTGGRRVILATNLAETTLTVPDVTSVVDTGLHKVARYDADRAIDSLETERVSQDSADQRAGRAGRVQAGVVTRLWDRRDRLRAHREAEIGRIDLAAVVLDVLAWGGDPRTLPWFEPPPPGSLDAALALLARLGAVDARGALTGLGRALRRIPLHPRLGRMLLAGRGAPAIARACALLSERHVVPPRKGATTCDLLSAVDREQALPPHVQRVARDLGEIARAALGSDAVTQLPDAHFRRAVFAGYPDRLARRRAPGGDRFVLASGTGARLGRESGVVSAEFVAAVDVTSGSPATGGDALIRLATGIEREWIEPTSEGVRHEFDAATESVRAARVALYDGLVISEHPIAADPLQAGPIVTAEYIRRGPAEADRQLLRRLAFAGVDSDFADLVQRAGAAATRLADVDLGTALPPQARAALAKHAPAALAVPGGRDVPLEYRDGGVVVAAVRIQKLFGLADSPRIGPRRVPVTFELLAPNGRPVQVTSDLRSFWTRGYPEARKALRARYPKHSWPEDPWTAKGR
jgi:ATP-dependent helicase HrpB